MDYSSHDEFMKTFLLNRICETQTIIALMEMNNVNPGTIQRLKDVVRETLLEYDEQYGLIKLCKKENV